MGHFTNEYSISYGNDLIINYNYYLMAQLVIVGGLAEVFGLTSSVSGQIVIFTNMLEVEKRSYIKLFIQIFS